MEEGLGQGSRPARNRRRSRARGSRRTFLQVRQGGPGLLQDSPREGPGQEASDPRRELPEARGRGVAQDVHQGFRIPVRTQGRRGSAGVEGGQTRGARAGKGRPLTSRLVGAAAQSLLRPFPAAQGIRHAAVQEGVAAQVGQPLEGLVRRRRAGTQGRGPEKDHALEHRIRLGSRLRQAADKGPESFGISGGVGEVDLSPQTGKLVPGHVVPA